MTEQPPGTPGLVAVQVHYQLLAFRRVPIALFFTLVLPAMMLVLFNVLFAGEVVARPSGPMRLGQYYTGGIAAFVAASATFTNLATLVPIRRDEGVLKRWRGTPLASWIYFAGLIGSALVIATFGVGMMIVLGVAAYDVQLEIAKLPALVITFLVAIFSCSALGLALGGAVPTASSASAIANGIILPLAFISNVFIAVDDPPEWLDRLGDLFPLKPIAEMFQDIFDPAVDPPALQWGKLTFVAAWGALGALVALRMFRWEPSPGRSPRRSRRATPEERVSH